MTAKRPLLISDTSPRGAAAAYLKETLGRSRNERLFEEFTSKFDKQEDKSLFTALIKGVERHKKLLEYTLKGISGRPPSTIKRHLRVLLLVGLYQLLFMDRIPSYAAVNETINALKSDNKKEIGFLNAILRKAVRGRRTLPPLPDQPIERRLSVEYSFPTWLTKEMIKRRGAENAASLFVALNSEGEISATVNTLKYTLDDVLSEAKETGAAFKTSPIFLDSLRFKRKELIKLMPFVEKGMIYIQNESARCAPILLNPSEEEIVLDVCSAPGGKAFLIQKISDNSCRMVCIERDPKRAEELKNNFDRLGVENFQVDVSDFLAGPPPPESADKILLDAPCSSLGTARNHPDVKWRHDPSSIKELASVQFKMLDVCSNVLKKGGLLVYSVCTFTLEETEKVVDRFLSSHSEFKVENQFSLLPRFFWQHINKKGYIQILPNDSSLDAHFVCGLRKIS